MRELSAREPVSEEDFQHSLSELAELARACEMEPLDTLTQSLSHINNGLYVGTGKAEEIRACAEMLKPAKAPEAAYNGSDSADSRDFRAQGKDQRSAAAGGARKDPLFKTQTDRHVGDTEPTGRHFRLHVYQRRRRDPVGD